MKLTKHHGLGNDFLITWVDAVPVDAADLARHLCHRHTGLGADGLVFGVLADGAAPQFVLHNADGSAPEVSGNGLRCFGQALAMRNGVTELDATVGTPAGDRHILVVGQQTSAPDTFDVEVNMGPASTGPDLAGRDPGRLVDSRASVTVDMGNPHVVVHVEDPLSHDMAATGPLIEADFPATGMNVHMVAPDPAVPGGVIMNIWERGAGVTQACGSGACAAAWAAHHWGWSEGNEFRVRMPGGEATVVMGDSIRLRGPAVFVAEIDFQRKVMPHG